MFKVNRVKWIFCNAF